MNLSDKSLLADKCYVAGKWRGESVDAVTNPATDAVLASVPRFGGKETVEAVEAAEQAFPAWSALTAKARSAILRRWYELILENRNDLALIMTSEQGKPLAEARGEIESGAAYIEFYAEEAKRVYGEIIPTHRSDARIMVLRQPLGVVAAITPWNFPSSMIARKVAPALAAGCTVVVKPAPETPLSALALAVLAERAGVPAGVLNIITGDAVAIGQALTSHPTVRLIGFTGSTDVGKLLMKQAADTVKKVGLELGGNAPFIVFDDADIPAAVEGAMLSKFRNMGQTCVCANRIYVQDRVHDEFVAQLVQRVSALKIGAGTDPDVQQGPLISMKAVEKMERHVADAVAHGAKVVVGGKRHALGKTFFEPTVVTGMKPGMANAEEETFAPLAPIYRFTTDEDVVAQANDTRYGLAAYFFAKDAARIFRVAEALEYGMVGVNTGMITTEAAPFGGVKQSGIGREGSRHGIEEYTEIKYVLLAGI
ncbi:MAG TPA: NAD-dependent succinate-semialdehyde dehydrogenase [Afipia sp.]